MYLHKTKNGNYTPPCCYFSGELEVVEILRFGFCCKYKFPKGVISIVNSFPAAYIISTDKETCGLCDLFDMCSENIDEIVEIVIDLNSCYFAGSKHYRPMLWPCNVDSNEDGAAFLLGYDKVMEASKLAVHSEDSIKKIRARLSSGKR